jgi:hypothetical protein
MPTYPETTDKVPATWVLDNFYGFPYCHTTGREGPEVNPILRKPGVGRPLADPNINRNQSAFNCSSEFTDRLLICHSWL